jgi:acetyltransferase-like isoleucine patch superfamily enzyme
MEYAAMLGRNGNPRFDEDWIDESFQYTEVGNCKKSVTIGSDVWIGKNVTISTGVVIGDGCVIAQGSLVRGDCKPYGIYAGYPAKLVRYRFSEDHIKQLLDIQWWNWSMDLIKKNSVFFNTNLKTYKGDIKNILLK